MDDAALGMAIKRLLGMGEAAEDSRMRKYAASKKPAAPAETCPECKEPLADGKCAKCGYEAKGEDESELAELLEQG